MFSSLIKLHKKISFKFYFHGVLVLLFISFSQINAQNNAECHFPRLTPRHGLSLEKLMGQWFLHEFAASDRGFDSVNPDFKCNQLNYVPDSSANVSTTGRFTSIESQISTSSGKLQNFRIPINVPKLMSPVSAIWDATTSNGATKMLVLNTDLEHRKWFVLYSCSVSGVKKYRWETIGIWSRSRFLDAQTREILKDFMIGLGFPIQSHKFHDQSSC